MSKKSLDYTAARVELDQILANLQDETLGIDEVTKQYERGMELVAELQKYLKTAENKVKKVTNKD